MAHTLVEVYGTDTGSPLDTIYIGRRSYPANSLIEDEDGFRWLLLPGFLHIRPAYYARAIASGAVGLVAHLTTGWASITVEDFLDRRTEDSGAYHLARGWVETPGFPSYSGVLQARPSTQPASLPPPDGFVHLHTHSEFSPMDGRSRISEIVDEVVRHGQQAVAITDHGLCPGHPGLQIEADRAGIKPIFGIEAYFVHDRLRRKATWYEDADGHRVTEEDVAALSADQRRKTLTVCTDEQEVRWGYHHLTLLAMDNTGLRNLWGASTESFRDGKYQVPRMDWDTLTRHAEGIICLTGCVRGPLAVPILDGDLEMARANLGRLMDIFGDRLYLEVMPNDLPEQVTVNRAMLDFSRDYDLPLVATVDSHYPTAETQPEHRAWVAVQTDDDAQGDSGLFAKDLGLYVQSEEEVRKGLLGSLQPHQVDRAIASTTEIAQRCTARIETQVAVPIFTRGPEPDEDRRVTDEERLLDLCLSNWTALTQGKPYSQDEAMARFEHEFPMIVSKGFCGYFLQVADYVNAAKAAGCRVGPGRGSGGGSFVAYLARIVTIDPIEAGLMFERFMTEGRTALPDFDIDFPSSWRHWIQDYISHRYGEEKVARVGTHLRRKNKGIIQDMGRAMKATLPETAWRDLEAVSKIIEAAESSTAGLGLSWEELMAQEGEVLQPYLDKYPDLFDMAGRLVGILKSYGKHPAGLVVSSESLVDSLPLRDSEDDQMIAQFDMAALEAMGYIKFDLLTLRTLDTIQETIDLIKANRHHDVDIDSWKDEYLDPQVWEALSDGHTLGVFQVETPSGTRLIKEMRPVDMHEFADVLTLVRPGPRRSGLTKLYLERRAGRAETTYPDPRLAPVLGRTHGCMIYQEDIMQATMVLAGYDSTKADEVRQILGKKKVEKTVEAGREFIEGCVSNGMDRRAAEALWKQMAEFAKYSFNRAHAYGYAVLAYWTAWLKVHYPVEFYTSVLSTVSADRIPEFITEARTMGLSILPPDINESGRSFSCQGLSVRYGLEAIGGIGQAASAAILKGQPYSSFEDFRERSGVNSGVTMTLVRIGAFDQMVPNRRGLESLLTRDKTGESSTCTWKDPACGTGPQGVCTFDWSREPVPVNKRTGKTLKPKPLPKRCTKACRNYTAPEPLDLFTIEPYTPADIRDIEMEVLKVHLSSTVFDEMDEEERQACLDEIDRMEQDVPGTRILAVAIVRIRKHTDRNGKQMAFLGVYTERGELDVTVFSKVWARHQDKLTLGSLLLFEVSKNSKGLTLEYANTPIGKGH